MIHPEGEARKESFHPCLSGLIRGSILWLFMCGCRLSCGFTLGVLKGVSELIQFAVRHTERQARFTPWAMARSIRLSISFARPREIRK